MAAPTMEDLYRALGLTYAEVLGLRGRLAELQAALELRDAELADARAANVELKRLAEDQGEMLEHERRLLAITEEQLGALRKRIALLQGGGGDSPAARPAPARRERFGGILPRRPPGDPPRDLEDELLLATNGA